MFVVDTNVLLYAADTHAVEHKTCHALLEAWRHQASNWFLTWNILYEFLRVSTHPRVFYRPWNIQEAWNFIESLLASPSLDILVATDRHAAVAKTVLSELPHLSGNKLFDAHTAILMKEHGIGKIYTRDTDFYRFSFLQVSDPLS